MSNGNVYYDVKSQFKVIALAGHTGSNCYIGRSRILQAQYEDVTAKRGDQIHILVGGKFLVRADGTVRELVVRKTDATDVLLKNHSGIYVETSVIPNMTKVKVAKEIRRPKYGYRL